MDKDKEIEILKEKRQALIDKLKELKELERITSEEIINISSGICDIQGHRLSNDTSISSSKTKKITVRVCLVCGKELPVKKYTIKDKIVNKKEFRI